MASKAFWDKFWARYDDPGSMAKPPKKRVPNFLKKLIFFILIVALLLGGLWAADRYVPPQHLPWRSLDINAPIGMATAYQLSRLADKPTAECVSAVSTAKAIVVETEPAFKPGGVCGWDSALTLKQAGNTLFQPTDVTSQCGLSAGIYIWIEAVRQAAVETLGSSVVRAYHYSTYSCRRQNGNHSGQWSEHAFANAWDVSGFELADGRKIFIEADWNGANTDVRRFLRQARDAACDVFHVTLSPDYNAAHADHFHLDMGPARSCR